MTVISVAMAPLTSSEAISPRYIGAAVYAMPYPRPEISRDAYIVGTFPASITSIQPMMYGTEARSSVFFLPILSARYDAGMGLAAEKC